MLQTIRDRAQGVFAFIVFGIIIVAFSLWGINFYMRTGGEVVVAKINGSTVKLADFEKTFQDYRQQLQAAAGGQANINQLDPVQLRQQVLQQMIDTEVMRQASLKAGMRVSDGQVAQAIQTFESFQREGHFAGDLYANRLRQMGVSPLEFEDQIRHNMLTEQLRKGITLTGFLAAGELNRLERLKNQKRDLVYAVISAEPFKAQIHPTDAEIEAFYKADSSRYLTPEKVKIAYLELSADELAKTVEVEEASLKDYYESHKAAYTTQEERSANHILVHVPKDAKPEAVDAARKQAEAYLAEAKSGKSFEDIAIAHSDDVGSKGEGGKTGFFRRGGMAKEFEDAAFDMKPGEIRGPIRTEFGFHVIRLNEVKPEVVKTFEEAKADIEKAYRQEQAEKLYYEKADQLSTLTYENSDSLEPAAKALGLQVKQTDFFDRGGGKDLLADAKVQEAAFSPEVLKEGLNSQPLELSSTHAVVLRMIEHAPAVPKELASVRQEIVDALIAERAKAQAAEHGHSLFERLRKGEDREAVAQSGELAWTESKGVTREDPKVNRAVARTAFKLAAPTAGGATYAGVPLGTGDFALVGVLAVHDGETSKPEDSVRKQTQQEVLQAEAITDWKDFVTGVKSRAKVETHVDKL